MTTTIRPASESDRVALRDLDRRAWTLTTNPVLPDGNMWEASLLGGVLVATRHEAIIGYVHLADAMPAHIFSAAHVGRIRGFAVCPEARRGGVGTALMEHALELARDLRYTKLVLQVLSTNLAAQRLYERAGFACEGRLTGMFVLGGERVDDLWYARWL